MNSLVSAMVGLGMFAMLIAIGTSSYTMSDKQVGRFTVYKESYLLSKEIMSIVENKPFCDMIFKNHSVSTIKTDFRDVQPLAPEFKIAYPDENGSPAIPIAQKELKISKLLVRDIGIRLSGRIEKKYWADLVVSLALPAQESAVLGEKSIAPIEIPLLLEIDKFGALDAKIVGCFGDSKAPNKFGCATASLESNGTSALESSFLDEVNNSNYAGYFSFLKSPDSTLNNFWGIQCNASGKMMLTGCSVSVPGHMGNTPNFDNDHQVMGNGCYSGEDEFNKTGSSPPTIYATCCKLTE